MSRFEPRRLSPRSTNLVIGTSRTKYIQSKQVGAAIHSYRGATLSELCTIIEKYPQQKLNTLIIIAGFNDHRTSPRTFADHWKYLIQLVFWKFRPTTAVIPKTIATSNNPLLNKKIRSLNFALFNLLNSLNLPILSPNFNNDFDSKIFCRDGIHFSFFGNAIFTRILAFYFDYFSCNVNHSYCNSIYM